MESLNTRGEHVAWCSCLLSSVLCVEKPLRSTALIAVLISLFFTSMLSLSLIPRRSYGRCVRQFSTKTPATTSTSSSSWGLQRSNLEEDGPPTPREEAAQHRLHQIHTQGKSTFDTHKLIHNRHPRGYTKSYPRCFSDR